MEYIELVITELEGIIENMGDDMSPEASSSLKNILTGIKGWCDETEYFFRET